MGRGSGRAGPRSFNIAMAGLFAGISPIGGYLIPTPKGIVTVNFVCSPMTIQAALPTLQKILASIEVAK